MTATLLFARHGKWPLDFQLGSIARFCHILRMSVCPLIASTIGAAKAEFGEAALATMRSLKRALDPLDILNPGKIVSLG
jgi:FAD/FMN-containing dehydrogenase